jgi:hypothetical protein
VKGKRETRDVDLVLDYVNMFSTLNRFFLSCPLPESRLNLNILLPGDRENTDERTNNRPPSVGGGLYFERRSVMRIRYLLPAATIFLLVFLIPGSGMCDEYNVVDVDGLNSAINSAENTVGIGDTINMAAGVYSITSTIYLSDPSEASLALIGEGPGQTILDGNGTTQILRINTTGGPGATSRILLRNMTLRNGFSSAQGGAAWVMTNAAELVVDNVWFEENISVNHGGGLYFNSTSGNLEVMNSYFFSNRNTGGTMADGGGLYGNSGGAGDIWIHESSFEKNHANYSVGGGASVVTSDGIITAERNLFTGNDATGVGGGLYVQTLGALGVAEVKNSLFAGNEANLGGGLNTYAAFGSLSVVNNTAVSNSATSGAGAMYAHLNTASASLEIYNNIFNSNTIGGGGGQDIYVASNNNGPVTAKYNNIEDLFVTDPGVLTEEFNIDVDPLLDAQYMLSAGSSCIDAGNNTVMGEILDLAGNDRFVDDPDTADTGVGTAPIVDMGAYEFQAAGGGGGGGGCNAIGEPLVETTWPGVLGVTLVAIVVLAMRRKQKNRV